MKNYVKDGNRVVVTAPYAVAAGAGCLVGSLFGVAESAIASGAKGVLVVEGVFSLVKLAGTAWTEGAKVYWDDAAKNCTLVVSTNKLIGVAVLAAGGQGVIAASGAVLGDVMLTKAFTV